MTYTVRPRVTKAFLWFEPLLMFELWQQREIWDDPTYGNGGGEWVLASFKVGRYHCEQTANDLCNKLNAYGDKK